MTRNEKRNIFILLCSGCISISFNVAAIVAVLPSMAVDLDVNAVAISRILPAYMIPYGLGALIYAPLMRLFSCRIILYVPLCVYSLAAFLCFWDQSLGTLMLGRMVMGVSGASIIPIALILIGKIFARDVRGRLVGLLFGTSFISSIAGITLGGLVHWRWLFGVPAVLGLLTAIGISSVRSGFLSHVHGYRANYFKAMQYPPIGKIFIFIFFMSALYHGVHKWFGLYLSREYILNQTAISMIFIAMSLSSSAGQILGGFVADKQGRNQAVICGLVILTLATLILCGHYPLLLLIGNLLLFSAGWTVGHTGVSTILTDFPDQFRPEIASLNSSVRFLAGGIGVSLSSLLVEASFQMTFFIIGLMMAVLLVLHRPFLPTEKNTCI